MSIWDDECTNGLGWVATIVGLLMYCAVLGVKLVALTSESVPL